MPKLIVALFAVFLIAHGLVHLLGFARGFGWSAPGPMPAPLLGLLWLGVTLLMIAAAVLLLAAPRWWWLAALPAVVLSELLIIGAWREAKWGTLVNLVILIPVALALIDRTALSQASVFRKEVASSLGRPSPTALISEADLAPLPPPVARYLRYVGAVGKPRVQNFRVVFRGQMRAEVNASWMNITAEQYSFVPARARLFYVRAARFGVPFDSLHRYIGPAATMQVKIASLLKVVDARGPKMDQSETVTMLNDLCLLAPAALVDAGISWQTVDDQTVGATFSNAGHTVAATLHFASDGPLVNFQSGDRFMTADGRRYLNYRWSTPVGNYRDFNGFRLAATGEAIWATPSGPFKYARFEIAEISYNVTAAAAPAIATTGPIPASMALTARD